MSDIELVSFDDDGITFELRGLAAMRLAKELGAAHNYEPCSRTKAVVCVTLIHEALTEDACFHKFHSDSGDADSIQHELLR